MTPSTHRQRGEGKVGCVVSLVVLLIAIAAAFKAVPVLWSESEIKDSAKDFATRASFLTPAAIETQMRAKARELDIPQAVAAGAITATKSGDNLQGTCKIRMKYSRKIDFYGVWEYTLETDTTIVAPYMNAN